MRLLLLVLTLCAACGGDDSGTKVDAAMSVAPDLSSGACSFAPTACTGQQTGQSCVASASCSLCDGADPYVCTCVDSVWQCQNGAVPFDMAYYGDGGV